MNIIDETGKLRTEAWLNTNFGPVSIINPAHDAHQYIITELRARTGPATISVTVRDNTGHPLPNIATVWHWPDAPALPKGGWHDAGVVGLTNHWGHVGHAMGKGAFYSPPTQGPHSIWILGNHTSQLIQGLGMIAGSQHRHLDITFQDRTGTPPSPPDTDTLHAILQLIQDARDTLATYITQLED